MKKFLSPVFVVVCVLGAAMTASTPAVSRLGDTRTRATTATTGSQLGNISTRGLVQTGNNVMIGGFIIQGAQPKKVIVRALGPTLTGFGVANALGDPTLELHDSTGALIASNNNWQTTKIGGIITDDQVSAIQSSSYAPPQASESAIIATLPPGNYTAIVRGNNATTGVALVEVYNLDQAATAILDNISTRDLVQAGNSVMIGGFIIQGAQPKKVIVRALGPTLTGFGVANALGDPTLELHDSTGALIASNDNWQTTKIGGIITVNQVSEIQNSHFAPPQASESAIVATLPPGNYTAIVRGNNATTGVALVEVYDLAPDPTPASGFFLSARGLYTQIERRGWASGYWSGDLIHTFNDFDSVVGSTVAQEAALQLDKMRAMGVNTITFELRTSDPTEEPGQFVPPACNIGPSLGFQWPQPTSAELSNLVAFFDLVNSKGTKVLLRLVNTHMEEQPPTNASIWLGAILGAIKNHPALDLVLFEGNEHVHHTDGQPDTCGIPAEPPLYLGATSYAGQYVKWALNFGRSLGMPWRKLSAEAIIGDYFVDSEPPSGPSATDEHLWSPIVILKKIFDDLGIPSNERTYAVSFYSHRKCLNVANIPNIPCTDIDPHAWGSETLQRVFETIGTGNGARVVAPEMGLSDTSTPGWTSERALESLYSLMEQYAVDGGSYWRWTSFETQEDSDPTKADPVKRRGVAFVYNPVQKEVLDIGGFHIAIRNKSFEAGTSVPDHWTITGNGTGSRHFLAGETGEPEVPSRGQFDLRLVTGSGVNDAISAISDPISITPTTKYTTTANLRFRWSGDPNPNAAPILRPQVFVSFHYFDSQGNPSAIRAVDVFRFFQENSTTNGFATFPMQYTPPSDAASIRIEIGAARNGLPTAITFDADNLR